MIFSCIQLTILYKLNHQLITAELSPLPDKHLRIVQWSSYQSLMIDPLSYFCFQLVLHGVTKAVVCAILSVG